MRRWFCALGLFMALACGDEESEPQVVSEEVRAQAPDACQPYGADAEVFGYCMVDQVSGMKTPETAADLCSLAGEWEGRVDESGVCTAWVLARPACEPKGLGGEPSPEGT